MKMKRNIQAVLLMLLTVPATVLADLTGVWKADDGGTYYVRQTGHNVHWYGERSKNNPAWSNVFVGEKNGKRIKGRWVDVPKGNIMGRGTLKLEVRHRGNVLVARKKTGGFGGSRWTRVGYNPAPAPAPAPGVALNEDCIGFSTQNAQVQRINGRWKIVDGGHMMFDFGNKRNEARKSLRVIKHYRLNKSCFVGRPGPSFTYMKNGNRAPVGFMPNEDCVSFNNSNANVRRINGRWKIVDSGHMMFDFGNNQQEARKSLRIIKRYGFNKSCFVGRPGPSFSYLRK